MADAKKLIPFLLKWEGGFVNDPADAGGATMKGVTLATFRKFYGPQMGIEDLKRITDEQWLHIFKTGYWDKCGADKILSQSVANALVDWAYNSGMATAAKAVQKIAGVTMDGMIGNQTITAINSWNARKLFDAIKSARIQFIENIVKNKPSQGKFLKGWMNRINALTFEG